MHGDDDDDDVLDAVREADGDEYDALDTDGGEDAGFDDDSSVRAIGGRAAEVAAAALVGAALGAGLGWLAYQAGRPAARGGRTARGAQFASDTARGRSRAARRALRLADVVAEATRESAGELRAVVEETLRRELRGIVRAARGRGR